MDKNDGGAAFPVPCPGSGGMRLRDWFAGQAMAALIPLHPRGTAREAYEYADAMLAERERAK